MNQEVGEDMNQAIQRQLDLLEREGQQKMRILQERGMLDSQVLDDWRQSVGSRAPPGVDDFGRGRSGGVDDFGRGRSGGVDDFGRGSSSGVDDFGRGRLGGMDDFGRGGMDPSSGRGGPSFRDRSPGGPGFGGRGDGNLPYDPA